jgi:hypothetical protein
MLALLGETRVAMTVVLVAASREGGANSTRRHKRRTRNGRQQADGSYFRDDDATLAAHSGN